nr:ubiquitin-like-conjugating enzyme ATG10 [Procambarus clarkii]
MACLTYEEFTKTCLEFFRKSQDLGDNWECRGSTQEEGAFYLRKTVCSKSGYRNEGTQLLETSLHLDQLDVGCRTEENLTQCNDKLEPYDPSALNDLSAKNFITFEYHVVYSLSHSVPTLYFNAWNSAGKLLTLEEVWGLVHSHFSEQILNNKWESLTQKEHPLLGRPFFQLHPCHTAKLMSQVKSEHQCNSRLSSRYIVSWLSMFGPVVGLELPLNYFLD